MENKIKEIKANIQELEEKISGTYAEDIKSDYDIKGKSRWQIEEMAAEFADSNVNIYTSDIWDYYESHKEEASNALKEFGYELSCFNSLDEAIEQGSRLAQYEEIYNEILEYIDDLEELGELYEELEELEEEEDLYIKKVCGGNVEE